MRRAAWYLMAVVAACVATSSARGEDDAALVAAAKAEGKLTFYTSFLGAQFHLAAIKSFEKKYGIPVELLDVRASELRERLRTEQAAGRFIGDVIQNGAATMIRSQRDGELQPHGGIANARLLSPQQPATDVLAIEQGFRVARHDLPDGKQGGVDHDHFLAIFGRTGACFFCDRGRREYVLGDGGGIGFGGGYRLLELAGYRCPCLLVDRG